MRMSLTTRRVLHAFLDAPGDEHYGLELMKATGLRSGTLYPVLGRLEELGLIVGEWEDVDASIAKRPRRRFYRLTPNGVTVARETVREALGFFGVKLVLE